MSALDTQPFWSIPAETALARLETRQEGLSSAEANARLATYGPNTLEARTRSNTATLLLAQFKSPIILILIGGALLSLFLGDPTDTLIILAIVLISGLLGFWQEHGAAGAVEKLLSIIEHKTTLLRDGQPQELPVAEVVPGDIVLCTAGASLPGDCLLLEARDLYIDEATLTGETYPVAKLPGVLSAETALSQRTNTLFMGTHVVSGNGKALVVRTGPATEFGKISERLKLRPPETDFERGVRRFGYFLAEITLILVIIIFAINVLLNRPALDSFLFSLALAIGLTPQMLPVIISINLSHGARNMARKKVIVKRLAAIENFGSMNILCSDKTGTLTEGQVRIHATLDVDGQPSESVLHSAYLNTAFQSGFTNPIDDAIRTFRPFDLTGYRKLDEVPYDFLRKRLSILVATPEGSALMVTKGALKNVLEVCSLADSGGKPVSLETVRDVIMARFTDLSGQGYRVLGVATRQPDLTAIAREDEARMTFAGFLVLEDPPKAGIVQTIEQLHGLGITLKVITGDNVLVAAHLGNTLGMASPRVLTGGELRSMSDEALIRQMSDVHLFAEIEPNQKERIIVALKKAGNVVGYMGDGINDASALHAADVGISVEGAADVAKNSADIILLEHDLRVLVEGVMEGRRTFANTLKYVFLATSANFGNMFSMAAASVFLTFLPLLPKQILLTNLLTDFPEMTIATDSVDPEMVNQPRRWNIAFIRRFMLTFGLLSSAFDFLTFGVLLFVLRATPDQFRTGWFTESVISAALIVFVIRTRRPFFRSAPSRRLLLATLAVAGVVILLPVTPLGPLFGFTPLPPATLALLGGIVVLYLGAAETVKRQFYRRAGN